MQLKDIVKITGGTLISGNPELHLSGMTNNSREVTTGDLFVAIVGSAVDGHDYITQATAAGAGALLVSNANIQTTLPCILVENTTISANRLAAPFFGYPARDLVMIGITGTNGKTTSAYMLEAILKEAGYNPGVISTIEYRFGGQTFAAPNTCPEPIHLQRLLRDMRDARVTHCIMEVSSHAIKLGRVMGLEFHHVLFTNLSVEHTEFHPDMEDYFHTKARLFKRGEFGVPQAVINLDDAWGSRMLQESELTTVTIGEEGGVANLVAASIKGGDGAIFTLKELGESLGEISINLAGRFNVINAMGAIAVARQMHIDLAKIRSGLDKLPRVPGRFDNVLPGHPFPVIVDYAHTPAGLENLLMAARMECSGRLIAVFGCGGDRSREKRPIMGGIVGRLADLPVLTSDNPRTEEPDSIIADVLPGLQKECCEFLVEKDRRTAIGLAIAQATAGDMVVIAGKGHEDYQIIGRNKIHFDDREVALSFLQKGTTYVD